jgi:Uma2 family endonuclease
MATQVEYPTSDGKPMAETEVHLDVMIDLIATLKIRYAAEPDVYVGGNMLLFYEEGNKRKHIAPDVMVTLGIPKLPKRLYYLLWAEGKPPSTIIEVTSRTTRREDQQVKRALYQDVLKVPEYFLFDPFDEYLRPPLQGYRLVDGEYTAIAPVAGRLPSEELGLHLERDGTQLRLFNPQTGHWLPTPNERTAAAQAQAAAAQAQARAAETRAEAMSRELEALKKRLAALGSRGDQSAELT